MPDEEHNGPLMGFLAQLPPGVDRQGVAAWLHGERMMTPNDRLQLHPPDLHAAAATLRAGGWPEPGRRRIRYRDGQSGWLRGVGGVAVWRLGLPREDVAVVLEALARAPSLGWISETARVSP